LIYEKEKEKWRTIEKEKTKNLVVRGGHTASLVINKIYIFAGVTINKKKNLGYLNDILVYGIENEVFFKPTVRGIEPAERAGKIK
jgi:N-acetylneuraminic acid mutarotase